MLTIAIMIPITAYFIDTFRTKTLMFSAMMLYFLGTFIGFLAPNFSLLLIGRIFQGLGSGIMIPLMQTILFILFPREKRGFAMGFAGMVINEMGRVHVCTPVSWPSRSLYCSRT